MIAKTLATVLRVSPVRSSSHIVTWLDEYGQRIATIVKGATTARSPFLGQYDLGYTCELLYYERATNGIHQIKECTPLHMRPYLRCHWGAMACASYACHLVNLVIPEGTALQPMSHALQRFLDDLEHQPTAEHLFRFELQALEMLGLAPRLNHCGRCGTRMLDPFKDVNRLFSTPDGGLICDNCRPRRDAATVQPVGRHVLAFLRGNNGTGMTLSLRDEFQTARILGRFLAYHLDLAPGCRDIALRLLRFRPGTTQQNAPPEAGRS